MREKEALNKADVRRVEEKMKNLFEEFSKNTRVSEGKVRQEFDNKLLDVERVSPSNKINVRKKSICPIIFW